MIFTEVMSSLLTAIISLYDFFQYNKLECREVQKFIRVYNFLSQKNIKVLCLSISLFRFKHLFYYEIIMGYSNLKA